MQKFSDSLKEFCEVENIKLHSKERIIAYEIDLMRVKINQLMKTSEANKRLLDQFFTDTKSFDNSVNNEDAADFWLGKEI